MKHKGILVLLFLTGGLWLFPRVWYVQGSLGRDLLWFSEAAEVKGWNYREIPVAESAEKLLVADRLVNGEFASGEGRVVRVFSAKRYQERPDDVGLFVHTPDRCWTQAGWKLEVTTPDAVEVNLHGRKLVFERRVFSGGGQRELVYFGGIVGGQPLPYRLDHNLSIGMRYALAGAQDRTGSSLRASDSLFWRRVWDSFITRSPLFGPKQFVRISTPVGTEDPARGDRLLVEFLNQWLAVGDYPKELAAWSAGPRGSKR